MKKTIILAVGVVVICVALVLTLVTCRNNENDVPTGEVGGAKTTTATTAGGNSLEIDINDLIPATTTAKTSYVVVTDSNKKPVTTYVPVTDNNGNTKTTYVPVTNAQGTTKTNAQGTVETTGVVVTTAEQVTTVVTVTEKTTTTTTAKPTTTTTTTTKAGVTTTTKAVQYDDTEGWSPIKPPAK